MKHWIALLTLAASALAFTGCIHHHDDDGFRARASMPGAEVDVDIDD